MDAGFRFQHKIHKRYMRIHKRYMDIHKRFQQEIH